MLNEIALTSIKRKLFCCYLFIIMSYLIRKPWIAAGKMSPQRFDYLEMHYNNCIVWLYKYVFIKNTFPWNYIMAGYCIKENPQLLQPLVFVHYAQKILLSAEEPLNHSNRNFVRFWRQKFVVINLFLLYHISMVFRHKISSQN